MDSLNDLCQFKYRGKILDISGVVVHLKSGRIDYAKSYLRSKKINSNTADEIIKNATELLRDNPNWTNKAATNIDIVDDESVPEIIAGKLAAVFGITGFLVPIIIGFITDMDSMIMGICAMVGGAAAGSIGLGFGTAIDKSIFISKRKRERINQEFNKLSEEEIREYRRKRKILLSVAIVVVVVIIVLILCLLVR